MAYTVFDGDLATDLHGEPLLIGKFAFYDRIHDEWDADDWDDALYYRSAYEFVREGLQPSQQAELDKVDAHWKANPKDFNRAFQTMLARPGKPFPKKDKLKGWVADEDGKVPPIPEEHWWWWPIKG